MCRALSAVRLLRLIRRSSPRDVVQRSSTINGEYTAKEIKEAYSGSRYQHHSETLLDQAVIARWEFVSLILWSHYFSNTHVLCRDMLEDDVNSVLNESSEQLSWTIAQLEHNVSATISNYSNHLLTLLTGTALGGQSNQWTRSTLHSANEHQTIDDGDQSRRVINTSSAAARANHVVAAHIECEVVAEYVHCQWRGRAPGMYYEIISVPRLNLH